MATERNPTRTSVNNIVSIETATEVMCMFPSVHVLFSRSSEKFRGANLRAHNAALCRNNKLCQVMPLQDKREQALAGLKSIIIKIGNYTFLTILI